MFVHLVLYTLIFTIFSLCQALQIKQLQLLYGAELSMWSWNDWNRDYFGCLSFGLHLVHVWYIILFHIIISLVLHIISDYEEEFWNDKIDVFKYQSNRSFRCSHLLAFSVSRIAIQLYSVGWQRCLPQRPRTGGWKKHAKGWWLGGSEWRVDRQHVLVAMICLDLSLKEYKRLSIDCMSFDDSFLGDNFLV